MADVPKGKGAPKESEDAVNEQNAEGNTPTHQGTAVDEVVNDLARSFKHALDSTVNVLDQAKSAC